MPATSWDDLGIPDSPFASPTPVQVAAIPLIVAGRDAVVVAPTGAGKTAAFGLPLLAADQRVLVVAPTRELATQLHARLVALGHTSLALLTGGVPRPVQREALDADPRVLVGTPGRLVDLHTRDWLALPTVDVVIVDEADQLLDAGFSDALTTLVEAVGPRQTLLFTATLPKAVEQWVRIVCTEPERIELTERPGELTEQVYYVNGNDRRALLTHLLARPEVVRALVFVRTRKAVDTLGRQFPTARLLHGDRTSAERRAAIAGFIENGGILIATDVAARGLDLPAVSHVVNVGMPYDAATYVHRIGRTARAGSNGTAWSICTHEDGGRLRDVERFTGTPLQPVLDHPWTDYDAIPDPRATATSRPSGRGRRY